jgi:ATP-dependent RNA helicase DHX57
MPSALRDLVEQTIRTSMPSFASAPATNDDGEPLPLSPNDTSTVSELTKIGWRKGHVLSALAYTQQMGSPTTLHNLLSHLHLHTPESDLPLAFRSSKPADANARIATSNGSEELARRWRIDEIVRRTGVPRLCVETAWEQVTSALDDGGRKSAGDEGEREEEGIVIALVTRRLVGWTVGAVDDDLDDQAYLDWIRVRAESEEREGLAERREDEILGLEGMFGTNKMRRTDEGVEIIATSPTKADDIVTLRVLFHPHSAYPSPSSSPTLPHLPTFYVHSASLPPYLLLHLTSLLMSRLVDPAFAETLDLVRGGYGGVINELVTHLSSVFRSAIDSPPDAREVLRFLEPQNVVTFGGGAAARGGGGKKKEVRRKAYRPPATMAAQQAMKRSLEANAERKAYGVMEDVRRKLPAWDMRDQIVQLIENNRVVIVSGETGSGKTTQVPSFVLDNAIAHLAGASTNIIVTQPRRVSAIGVATRVAAERLEDINDANSRSLIGYAIRGERKAGKDTRLLFCTTGVVLARLSRGGDPNLYVSLLRSLWLSLTRSCSQRGRLAHLHRRSSRTISRL